MKNLQTPPRPGPELSLDEVSYERYVAGDDHLEGQRSEANKVSHGGRQ